METLKFHNKIEVLEKLISRNDVVLDVGFWGQGITWESASWPHKLLRDRAKEVWGIDIVYDAAVIPEADRYRYKQAAAEDFSFDKKFDVVFAGDLIEHLVNPGLFLENVRQHLAPGGRLIMTTPNAFNIYVMAGKLTREEPPINPDHTFYFNRRTIKVLLEKCNFEVKNFGFMFTLGYKHKESLKKKILNILNRTLRIWTPKFDETLVIVATPK
jgi:2-polyprenyl-3-methyl-5-hydroxy-6-metoxy-1,4-benzoquinol methylase